MSTTTLLVRQDALAHTALRTTQDVPLADGQVRVRVERFALTANNITYAAMGGMLEYWQFFPSDETGWGIVPVWVLARWCSPCTPAWPWASGSMATGPCPPTPCSPPRG